MVSRTTLINNLLILCDYLSLLSVLCCYRSETLGGARLVGGVARWSFLGSDEVSIPLCLASHTVVDRPTHHHVRVISHQVCSAAYIPFTYGV